MNQELKTKGKYEIFTTPDGEEVINFDDTAYYSLSRNKDEEYMESTDPDPDKFSSKATGSYYYIGAENEDDLRGILYLEDGTEFRKLELPEGLPTKRNEPKKKVLRSKDRLKKEEVLKKIKS